MNASFDFVTRQRALPSFDLQLQMDFMALVHSTFGCIYLPWDKMGVGGGMRSIRIY